MRGPRARSSFGDLFAAQATRRLSLHVRPDWEKPCKSCSFWADGFNGIGAHLAQRDTRLVAISRAPLAKLEARAKKMGWTFPWYSSEGSDFNYDFGVSFRPEDLSRGPVEYNYEPRETKMTDLPGISTFLRDGGEIFHTYSCFSRGLDMMNPAYQLLDLTALGGQEEICRSPWRG